MTIIVKYLQDFVDQKLFQVPLKLANFKLSYLRNNKWLILLDTEYISNLANK